MAVVNKRCYYSDNTRIRIILFFILEQRDLWCTQCKWKKACARFGKPVQTTQQTNNNNSETSLLMPAAVSGHSQAIRAIKF